MRASMAALKDGPAHPVEAIERSVRARGAPRGRARGQAAMPCDGSARRARCSPSCAPSSALRRAQWRGRELDSKLNMLGNVYGAHVPMRKRMDMRIVSAAQRMPGLPSSNLGLEILLNKHEDLEFDDFLADPAFSSEQIDVHLAMEKRLGLDRPIGQPIRALQLGPEGSLRAHRAAVSEA